MGLAEGAAQHSVNLADRTGSQAFAMELGVVAVEVERKQSIEVGGAEVGLEAGVDNPLVLAGGRGGEGRLLGLPPHIEQGGES